jgi:hypothetical protein
MAMPFPKTQFQRKIDAQSLYICGGSVKICGSDVEKWNRATNRLFEWMTL